MRIALLAILSSVLALSAAERVVYETDFANLTEIAKSPLVEKEYGPPAQWTGLLTMGEEGGIRHLALQVQSSFRPNLGPALPLQAGKVYRFELLARAVGQIEGVHLDVRKRTNPYTMYGATDWPVSKGWAVQTVQIKPQQDDAQAGLYLALRGVGTYQIRSLRVVETDGWNVPTPPPVRGEMLADGAFRLGGLGWHYTNPGYGGFTSAYAAAGHPSPWTARSAGPGADFTPLPGIFAFLCPIGMQSFYIGRTYEFTLRGEAADGDVWMAVLRPGANWKQVFKGSCNFKDGVATCRFTMDLPKDGALSDRVEPFGIICEYQGKKPARIASLSLREFVAGEAATPAGPPPAVVGVELRGAVSDPLGLVAVRGQAISARVRSVGLEATSCRIEIRSAGAPATITEVALAAQPDGSLAGDLPLAQLGCGYYQLTPLPPAPAQGLPLVCAVVPPPQANAEPDFLGAHFKSDDPRHIATGALIGLRTARCFEFGWASLEPKVGEFAFPEANLAAYLSAKVEPMVLLNGSPHWASSAPDNIWGKPLEPWAGWQSYPPRLDSLWRAYAERMATLLKGKVRVYQIWNEPNDYFLKVNPQRHQSLEEAYVNLVKTANAAIKAVDPQAIVVAGATAGLAQGFHQRCVALGLLDHCDVVSYHAYGECTSGGQGAAAFRPAVDFLHGLMQGHGPAKPVWDCESGYSVSEGMDGLGGAQLMLQGLVARKAAGIARHYIYNAYTKEFPSSVNFHMVFGYGERPLATVPVLALFDRLLNGAAYAADLGDDAKGIHAYAFKRGDGRMVAIGWTTTPEPRQTVAAGDLAKAVACDAWGNRVAGAMDGDRLVLDREPRWFLPAELATENLGGL